MVRVTLLSEYPIYHSFRVNTMSVSYVQDAKYKYMNEQMNDKAFSKVVKKLADKGLLVCANSHWSASPPTQKYGLMDETTTKTVYHVTINDSPAITTKYHSDAHSWKEQLTKNGFDCDYTSETTQTTKQVWAKPRGTAFYMDNCLVFTGERNHSQLKLLYDDCVTMTPSLVNSADGLTLSFVTRWETEKVARKADIESLMVQTPLQDLGLIQSLVEDALGVTAPVDIDCNFRCETFTESSCTPDIIAMRKQASIDARNASQEEE